MKNKFTYKSSVPKIRLPKGNYGTKVFQSKKYDLIQQSKQEEIDEYNLEIEDKDAEFFDSIENFEKREDINEDYYEWLDNQK